MAAGGWCVGAVLAGMLALAAPAQAVVILDSTWRAEGGSRERPWAGFGAHLRLADEPPFRAVLALASDGEAWGEASGTWLGNAEGHAYVLTAAHIYDEDAEPDAYQVRGPDGRAHVPDRRWVHPYWNGDTGTRTGYDLVLLRLPEPLTGLGEPPVLYTGRAEAGRLITFVGFGSRGIGSVGEADRFYRPSAKAAAQGVVDEWVAPARTRKKAGDAGNYLGVYLPREDGSIPNPYGGSARPATPLVGLLGSGDSGGSAWMPLAQGWVLVGVNSNGSGEARYGDASWFARVAPHHEWLRKHFPAVRLAPEP